MPDPNEKLVVRLSDLQPEPIDWLWPERLAGGKPALIDGDPSLGTSLLRPTTPTPGPAGGPGPKTDTSARN